jgi:hypothetical protein
VLVLSKQVPLGIGAVLGGGGNHVFGRMTVKSSRKIFGDAPTDWADAGLLDSATPREPVPSLSFVRAQPEPPAAPA